MEDTRAFYIQKVRELKQLGESIVEEYNFSDYDMPNWVAEVDNMTEHCKCALVILYKN